MTEARLLPVHVLGVPLDLHRRSSQHAETLRRELAFVAHAAHPDAAPARLQVLGASIAERFGMLTIVQQQRLADAMEAGEATIDLHYELPVEVADACDEMDRLLDELDAFCHEGGLLTLVTPEDARVYRRWFLDEVRGQLRAGRAPRPWAAPAGSAQSATVPGRTAAAGADEFADDPIVVGEDLDLSSAPTLREQIVARTDAGAARITIDVTGCTFMDSTGLSLLLTTHLRLAATGGALRVVGASGQVASLLEMSGVDELLLGR